MTNEFWETLDKLIEESEIVIDRPKDSAHPRYPQTVYEVDYGYLKNTSSTGGDGLDVWLGSGGQKVIGIVCTVDLMKRDSEIKLLIGCNDAEIESIRRFHNDSPYMKGLLIRREL